MPFARPSLRGWPSRLLVSVTAAVVSVLILEVLSRAYLHIAIEPAHAGESQPPLPYRDAEYYSPQFLYEQAHVAAIAAPSGAYFVPDDTHGRYINVAGGRRVTIGQPQAAVRRVLVFGGSTVFSEEVPDELTIPSLLQRTINVECATPVAVRNDGINSMTTRQNRQRLAADGVRAGDIIVMYGGVNDVYYNIYAGGAPLLPRVVTLWDTLRGRALGTGIGAVAAQVRYRSIPATMRVEGVLDANVARAEAEYEAEIMRAHRFAAAHGAAFLAFLQPHLFASPLSTPYRQAVSRDPELVPPGLSVAFRYGYPRLRAALHRSQQAGVAAYDVSGLLAASDVPGEVFLDFAHINEVGNAMVAEKMFARVAPLIGDCADGAAADN